MKHPTEGELNDFADGSLEAPRRQSVARHLARCEACREEVEWVRGLLSDAAALGGEVHPPRDLWPGIAARIEAERRDAEAAVVSIGERTLRATRPWLAAAAVVLVAASSAVTVLVLDGAGHGPLGGPAVAAGGAGGGAAAPERIGAALPASARAIEAQYAPSIESLRALLRERQDEMTPETREIVERNLDVIDAALAEIRRALMEDPSSPRLLEALSDGYERKLNLLREAALLPAAL